MASITVFQDQENLIQGNGNVSIGLPRVAPKPFIGDNMPQATPRRALGDVRNIPIQKQNSSMKAVIQSEKKVPSSALQNSKSSFRKPFGTSKKTGKHAVPILEDGLTEKSDVKEVAKTKQIEACSLQKRAHKENCFPFTDTGFQFSIPNYLKELSTACISDSVWLPTYTWCKSSHGVGKTDSEPSKIVTENLPPHLDHFDVEDSLFDDVMTDFQEVSNELPSYPDKFCELGDIDHDLANIDISCSLSIDYPDLLRKLDDIKLCVHEDFSIDENSLNTRCSNGNEVNDV